MSTTPSSAQSIPPRIPRSGSGLAIASLVVGVVAVCFSFLLLGGVFGLVGIILGLVDLRQSTAWRAVSRWGVGLSVFGLLASVGFGALYYEMLVHYQAAMARMGQGEPITQWEGVIAPDFSFTTVDGRKIALSDLRGRRVVVDFWATWCPPCRKEIPHFVHLAGQTSTNDLVVIGISSEDEKTLRAYIKENGLNYAIASVGKLPEPYQSIESIPTTLFIDRHGVLQNILVGYHDFETIRSHALQVDWPGPPKPAPTAPASGLTRAEHPLQAVRVWSADFPGATALCVGDWQGTGTPQILVADSQSRLHVLDLTGAERESLALPAPFTLLECGHDKSEGPRLLGYSNWSHQVIVMDRSGKQIWSYGSWFGVDGAHWGDLDGSGSDAMIVGMNGNGGLHAVSGSGKTLWKYTGIGNVWNQAVVPAQKGRPAMVFATEAGGSVKVFDAQGKLVRTIRPNGKYYAQMDAAVVDSTGTVQVIAIGENQTLAFDPTGAIAWSTPAREDDRRWRNTNFASGDLAGDGQCDWAFLEASGDLVIASPQGERLASIPDQDQLESFAIAPQPGGRGLLVTLKSGVVQAYRCEPTALSTTNSAKALGR